MNNKITLQEIIDRTVALHKAFRKTEIRPWNIDIYAVELLAEAGTLADSIMIKEGYRKLRSGQVIDLEDDICDVIFVLLMIAHHYEINVEQAYLSMIDSAYEKIANQSNNDID